MRHLVVVDDEPFVGRVIKMLFERGPFTVSTTNDGTAGWRFLLEHPDVACAFVDINMPGLTGLEILERAAREPRLKDVAFVVLTAAGDELQRRRAQDLGARAFVTKPFSPHKLYRQVTSLLGLSDLPDVVSDLPDVGV